MADDRPAIVTSWQRPVDFVATTRAMFDRPESLMLGVISHTLWISMSVAPDFIARRCIVPRNIAYIRIVGGHTAIEIEAYDGSLVIAQVLRLMAVAAIPHTEEDMAFLIKGNPATEMFCT